ncbi:MAG: pyruvate kinase alpha/beta domain-containing protein [Anaerolineaceae bacterium]|nr:pyruvate kinase alpha/beta domain-containing protein [Anaerolineaceae bacterium]
MNELETRTILFAETGEVNTQRTLELAQARMQALGIRSVVVATTTGNTGVMASALFKGINLVVVTHTTGYKAPDEQELTAENRAQIKETGARIYTGMHAFGGVGRAIRLKFGGLDTDETIAHTLRIFGQGVKVAVEMAIMAADAGLVRTDETVMCIAGTNRGADTAVILKPSNIQRMF